MDFDSRNDVQHFVERNMNTLIGEFAIYQTGNIFIYAVELDDNDKPRAVLHHHKKSCQMIWIELNDYSKSL